MESVSMVDSTKELPFPCRAFGFYFVFRYRFTLGSPGCPGTLEIRLAMNQEPPGVWF